MLFQLIVIRALKQRHESITRFLSQLLFVEKSLYDCEILMNFLRSTESDKYFPFNQDRL